MSSTPSGKHNPPKDQDFISAPRTGSLLLLVLRGLFIALMIGLATGAMSFVFGPSGSGSMFHGIGLFFLILCVAALVISADVFTRNKQITIISAIFFGLLMGFMIGSLFWSALEPIVESYLGEVNPENPNANPNLVIIRGAQLLITLVCCYISISLLIQTKDEFRFIIPYVEFSKQIKGGRPLVLDTSVIIDGRIADICETGVVDTTLIVPRFVLQELQSIADSSDKIKRNRGRRGLDVLKRMQSNTKMDLQMHEGNLSGADNNVKVDERLVLFAKTLDARVVTNDFNLNKIAQLQGVDVINLNELANALKLVALPGEQITIRIIKQGDQIGQGVGYLDDGTMVVVEQGRQALNQEVDIVVTSVLQTPAGRMIFGRIDNDKD